MKLTFLIPLLLPLSTASAQVTDCGDWFTFCVCGDFVDVSPCGNGTVGEGCFNSTGVGAVMSAQGCFSVANDDVVLTVEQLPPAVSAIVFASFSPANAQLPFGDGVLCFTGPFVRFPVQSADVNGTLTQGPGLAQHVGIQPGDVVFFQSWYRDQNGPCGSGFNLSSGIQTNWTN